MSGTAPTLPAALPFPLGSGEAPVTPDVGVVYSCAINGIGFMFDNREGDCYEEGFRQVSKNQFDTSREPGEQTLSDEFWRRARSNWKEGAGQTWADAENSSALRFDTSKNVDVWTENELSLLNATEQKRSSANTNLQLLKAGSSLYVVDGTGVAYTSDPTPSSPTFTAMTGLSGTSVRSICSDGTNIYVADGTRIKTAALGTAAASNFDAVAQNADLIGIVNGFFLAGVGRLLKSLDTSGAATDLTPTHVTLKSGSAWVWTGFCEGPNGPYAGGKAGEQGIIYRGVIDSTTGSLSRWVVAAELPDGETLEALASYLNSYALLGTNRGVRLGLIDQTTGNITYGPLINIGQTVRCFEPQDRFVWFNWDAFDSAAEGLGRLDLSTFTKPLLPAYSSDLMHTSSSNQTVTSVATFGSRRYFAISGLGFYGETGNKASSGYLTTGKIRWSTLEEKLLQFVDVLHKPLDGSVTVEYSKEDAAYSTVGTSSTSDSLLQEFRVASSGRWFELRFTLTRSGTDTTQGPTMTGWIAKAVPSTNAPRYFRMRLLNYDIEASLASSSQWVGYPGRSIERYALLKDYKQQLTQITFQGPDYGVRIGDTVQYPSYSCVVDDVQYFREDNAPSQAKGNGGYLRVLLKEISG